jgi:hypothetical protein
MAHTLLDMVKPNIREEDWHLALQEFYTICRAGIEVYEIQQQRMLHRLKPLEN